MEKVLNKFYNIIDKIGKHNILLILFIFIVTLVTGLYTTFSIFTTTDTPEIIDGLTTYKFILSAKDKNTTINIAANTTKNMDITVSNKSNTKLKYGVYYFSYDDLTDVVINYRPTSKHKALGMIEKNSDYVVTVKIINNSENTISINFGLLFGLENGGDLTLDSDKYWVSEVRHLTKATVGSYVDYIGNNGCTNENCTGINANRNETNNGYCRDSNYEYSLSGWRIAYIENDNVYLISAGAPECLCTNSDGSTSNSICKSNEKTPNSPLHIANLNNIAMKYCNINYVENGICNNQTTWAMSTSDFTKITKTEANYCYDSRYENICGYENDLIDINGQYWLASPTTNEISPNYHIQNWFAIERTLGDNLSSEAYGVRPIVKLDKKVFITGGTGTQLEPYKISKY